jgi:hypothetical protein
MTPGLKWLPNCLGCRDGYSRHPPHLPRMRWDIELTRMRRSILPTASRLSRFRSFPSTRLLRCPAKHSWCQGAFSRT